jgi:hypothetical protein
MSLVWGRDVYVSAGGEPDRCGMSFDLGRSEPPQPIAARPALAKMANAITRDPPVRVPKAETTETADRGQISTSLAQEARAMWGL